MNNLTTIEQLDQQFPGLADQVEEWFDQEVPLHEIRELLFDLYNVHMPPAVLRDCCARYWAREVDLAQREFWISLAALETVQEIQNRPVATTAPIQAKMLSVFLLDKNSRLRPIADPTIEFSTKARGR